MASTFFRISSYALSGLLFLAISGSVQAQIQDSDRGQPQLEPNPGINLEVTQDAWWKGDPKKSKDQLSAGYKQLYQSWGTVHRLNLRQGLLTTIRFDPTDVVHRFVIADTAGFEGTRGSGDSQHYAGAAFAGRRGFQPHRDDGNRSVAYFRHVIATGGSFDHHRYHRGCPERRRTHSLAGSLQDRRATPFS